ncbi:MAG: N-acetylglucosamine kinase [Hyphomicrobiales bacterium]|nr:MAG: N-acetylglucosamine kinase [Hyphomicrobiales bacterium]
MSFVLQQYLVGVDGGGTSCRVAVSDVSGTVLGRGMSGASNVTSDFEGAIANINLAVDNAFTEAGIANWSHGQVSAVLGLAGVNIGDAGERLTKQLDFAHCQIVPDTLIAHRGAFAGADGLLAIVGTGSAFLKIIGDEHHYFGGWGARVSDLASGAWLGRAVIESTLLAADGIRPFTDLAHKALSRFGGDAGALAISCAHAEPSDFAEYAPMVVDAAAQKDVAALKIMNQAAADLNEALHALNRENPVSICLWGGLAQVYAPLLSRENAARLQSPQTTALNGALSIAMERFSRD